MLFLKEPSEDAIRQFIESQRSCTLSYIEVGATKSGLCPAKYGRDRVTEELGTGAETFSKAVNAFKRWEQFDLGWVWIYPHDVPIIPGSVVAILAWHLCFWSLNACRIVYTIEEQDTVCKFGFGYGTLPDHAEIGEERFLVEWNKNTDIVSYDVLAFSNPNNLLGRLAYPIVRYIQNSFRRDSARLMKQRIKSLN